VENKIHNFTGLHPSPVLLGTQESRVGINMVKFNILEILRAKE